MTTTTKTTNRFAAGLKTVTFEAVRQAARRWEREQEALGYDTDTALLLSETAGCSGVCVRLSKKGRLIGRLLVTTDGQAEYLPSTASIASFIGGEMARRSAQGAR